MIYHFPGQSYVFKNSFIRWVKSQIVRLPEDLTVITCESRPNRGSLIKQLTKNNIKYINKVPSGIAWNNPLKITYIHEALKEVATKYVLILDNADVILDSGNMDIIDKFLATNKKLVYNASMNNWPKDCQYGQVSDINERGSFKYLNAGCCIGYTDFAKQFYSKCLENLSIENPHQSEQLIVKYTYEQFRDDIDIDSQCKLFQVMSGTVVYMDENQNWIIACKKTS